MAGLFSHNIWDIWDVILPIDFHIFQDGQNHQPVIIDKNHIIQDHEPYINHILTIY